MSHGIFDACTPGGVFACQDGFLTALDFLHAVISNNNMGEVITEYSTTCATTITGFLEPDYGDRPRYLHGIIFETNYWFLAPGNADVRDGDRTTISGFAVEANNILRYGTMQTEVGLKYVR